MQDPIKPSYQQLQIGPVYQNFTIGWWRLAHAFQKLPFNPSRVTMSVINPHIYYPSYSMCCMKCFQKRLFYKRRILLVPPPWVNDYSGWMTTLGTLEPMLWYWTTPTNIGLTCLDSDMRTLSVGTFRISATVAWASLELAIVLLFKTWK